MKPCECGCGKQAIKRFVNGHNARLHVSVEDRGYKTPCHIWPGTVDRDGYAHSGNTRLFRVVYERAKGKIPDGLMLDHLCRVRACINPDHGEPVTNAKNARRGKGTKLTQSQVDEIRSRYSGGTVTLLALGREYGVHEVTVWCIVHNRSWREKQ